ncbi:hypothetical protein [Streptosporangium sp. NBC_01756]|uniref:hypothetical protein n=1 Tax=Streptosporangium sp. NBC_01756 TaxID=2975950 RepID=UPI002DD7E600|nr:hypothetical protein [Streptosporangium sp. NBC_01756]
MDNRTGSAGPWREPPQARWPQEAAAAGLLVLFDGFEAADSVDEPEDDDPEDDDPEDDDPEDESEPDEDAVEVALVLPELTVLVEEERLSVR